MYRIFKNININPVTAANLPEVLKSYVGIPLRDVPKGDSLIPPGFQLINEENKQFIRRELKFIDFKEAFAFFNLINSTFTRYDYYPRIFNVYNKVVVDFSDEALSAPTTKDVFLARLLFEL